jgi:DHHA2 domain
VSVEGICRGLVSVFKMNRIFCPTPHRLFDSRRVVATVENLARTLGSEIASGVEVEREEELTLVITVMDAETDCKEFVEQGRAFSVAQTEELGFDQFWRRKDELAAALEEFRRQNNYFFSALLVTDAVRKTSLLLVAGAPAFLKAIDYPELEPGGYDLAGIVSRKKQLLPHLLHCLAQCGPAPAR